MGEQNIQRGTTSATAALAVPFKACGQFIGAATLPDLSSQGYAATRNGFQKKIRPGSIANPGGTIVTLGTNARRQSCAVTTTNAPFGLNSARSAAISALVADGWSHQGNLVYQKGASRARLTGSQTGSIVIVGLSV